MGGGDGCSWMEVKQAAQILFAHEPNYLPKLYEMSVAPVLLALDWFIKINSIYLSLYSIMNPKCFHFSGCLIILTFISIFNFWVKVYGYFPNFIYTDFSTFNNNLFSARQVAISPKHIFIYFLTSRNYLSRSYVVVSFA